MPKTIAIIPARFASRRFPGKPLAQIAGKSLIQRSYENALRCKALDTVVIATDDPSIQQHVRSFGAEVVMTSPDCLTGSDRAAEALALLPSNQYEVIVNIQGDEPFLEPDLIEQTIKLLQTRPDASMSTLVTKITSTEEASNPSITKCVCSPKGYALYFSRTLIPAGPFRPHITYYRHLGIYGFTKEFLPLFSALPPTPLQLAEDLEGLKVLEHGYRIATAVVETCGIGIDHPHDIEIAEKRLSNQGIQP